MVRRITEKAFLLNAITFELVIFTLACAFSSTCLGVPSGQAAPAPAQPASDGNSVAAGKDPAARPESHTPTEKKPSKLIAWWKLDEATGSEAADSSGNGCVGRLVGNPQWRPAGGKVGGALELDGADDYVEIKNEPAFDISDAITVAAWIKVNQFDRRWQTIVSKGDSAWRLQRTAEEDTLAFHCTGIETVGGPWPMGTQGNNRVHDGQWHHVVGVFDGSTVSLYLDGALGGSSKASGTIQANNFPVVIGDNAEVGNRNWNGLIDEVCILGCAMDANEVRALYAGEDPVTLAEKIGDRPPVKAAVVRPEPQSPSGGGSAGKGVEGDWQVVSEAAGQNVVIRITRKPDGTLTAAAVGDDPEQVLPLEQVTFENGMLRFAVTAQQGIFEGTMSEDGLKIEGKWRQEEQVRPVVLKRAGAGRVQPTGPGSGHVMPASEKLLPDAARGGSHRATLLILVLVLVGFVAVTVRFVVRMVR